MDPKFQTSFIPKKSYEESPKGANLLTLIAGAIFLVTLLGSGGVYLYNKSVNQQITASKATIQTERDSFELPFIDLLTRLDGRIEAGKKLLGAHVALSPLFGFFGANMLQSMRFDSLAYTQTPQKISVTAHGQAQSYQSIALQSDIFAQNRLIQNVIFSDFSLDQTGAIAFTFSATVNPDLVSYSKSLAAVNAPAPAAAAPASGGAPSGTDQPVTFP